MREAQSFYNDFFQVFDVERRSVARYEEHVTKLDDKDGFIDLFWPGVLLVEQKSAGRSLAGAYDQAGEYFDALKMRDRPRYILVSDFQNFELHDLDERRTIAFPLRDLPDPHFTIRSQSNPTNGTRKLLSGSKPIDNGNCIFTADQRDEFLLRPNTRPSRARRRGAPPAAAEEASDCPRTTTTITNRSRCLFAAA